MKNFDKLLDRYGTDLDQWPAAHAAEARRFLIISSEARQYHRELLQIERLIAFSRPAIEAAAARQVVNRALLSIRRSDLNPSWLDRFVALLSAPVPRLAFATVLTAIGFVIGFSVGTPDDGSAAPPGSPLMTASADDGLF